MKRNDTYYIGLDIHKRVIAFCVKTFAGEDVAQGMVDARRGALLEWINELDRPWIAAMEATMFTGWIYDFLTPYAQEIKVAHPEKLKAIGTAKKKSDRIDAETICDLLRVDLLPECYMAPVHMRELRRLLRERNLLVRMATRLKNKNAGLLMECGVEYDRARLHGKRYFADLLGTLEAPAEHMIGILRFNHEMMRSFDATQKQLLRALAENGALKARVERLMTIPSVGPVLSLTWALEIVDPHRFSAIRKAVSYCGLSSRYIESAGKVKRAPLSKKRNEYLQWALIEVAKMAPRHNPALKAVREAALEKGCSPNVATLMVARKLVAWMMAVDKSEKPFVFRENSAA
jgi:transposase